jgi:ribosomal protein S18 acetylase RimI-like enzyme
MLLNNLSLHIATTEDLDTLQQISLHTFYDAFYHVNTPKFYYEYTNRAFSKQQLLAELQNPDTEFQFLKSNDELVGYFKLNYRNAQSDVKDPHSLEIERIYTLKQYQSHGFGKFLLDNIKEIAKQKKLEYIWLGVWEKNTRAIHFYEKNGFRIFSSHDFHFGSDIQTDLLMRWQFDKLNVKTNDEESWQ